MREPSVAASSASLSSSRRKYSSRRLATALMNFSSEFFVKLRSLLLTAIHHQQLAPEKIEFPAQQRELAEHGAEGGSIAAPEVGDGLEVWLQGSQQPDDLDIAVAFGLKPPA